MYKYWQSFWVFWVKIYMKLFIPRWIILVEKSQLKFSCNSVVVFQHGILNTPVRSHASVLVSLSYLAWSGVSATAVEEPWGVKLFRWFRKMEQLAALGAITLWRMENLKLVLVYITILNLIECMKQKKFRFLITHDFLVVNRSIYMYKCYENPWNLRISMVYVVCDHFLSRSACM